jgi:hypothetical protein
VTPRRRLPWPLLALTVALATRASAQSSPVNEAEARAQRIADRVMEVIRNASRAEPSRPAAPTRTEAPRAPAKPAAPKPASPHAEPAGRAVTPVAATTPHDAPHGQPPTTTSAAASAPDPAASATVVLESVSVEGRPTGAVSLFDFEESASGFTLHARTNWALMPSKHIALTEQAQRGRQALAVQAPERAWLGVDLEEAVDFTELHTISYWLSAAQPTPPPFAIKTGTQYDWCRLTVTATDSVTTPAGTFMRYEADVKLAPQVCRYVDLSDVRGFFWELGANSPVVLDNVELR